MTKEKNYTNQEIIAKLYINCISLLENNTKQTISFYDYKRKILMDTILAHRKQEPLKIFKASHKTWEDRQKELYQNLHETEKKFIYEIENLEDIKKMLSFN